MNILCVYTTINQTHSMISWHGLSYDVRKRWLATDDYLRHKKNINPSKM